MRSSCGLLVALTATLLLGSLSEAAAQRRPEVWVMTRTDDVRQESGPFAAILDHGAELELSRSQLSRIREIQRKLVRENERLSAQIRDAEVWGVETAEEEAALAEVREKFDENVSAAELEVEALLTAEQIEAARELLGGDALAYWTPGGDDPESAEQEGEAAREAQGAADGPSTTARVENLGYHDATVYVYSGSRSQRLGFVTGLSTRIFTLPANFVTGGTGLRFRVRQITRSASPMSYEVSVRPGDEVLVRIPPA